MRSLSIFVRFLVIGVLAALAVFFVGREGLLLYTATQLNNHISELSVLSKNPAMYQESCKTAFKTTSANETLKGFQLRFTDDTHYRTEAVCEFHEKEPILIKQGVLPSMVRKTAGYSGLFFGANGAPTVLRVEVFGRTAAVGSEGATQLPASTTELVSPATSCTGFGFSCCEEKSQIPEGMSVGDKALDCPGRCFARCKSRPVVLSFRSDPPMDTSSRTLVLSPDTQGQNLVTFAYVVSDPDGKVTNVAIDFGDGQSQAFTATEARVEHTYSCNSPGSCRYEATVSVMDNEGNASPQGAGDKITVAL